MATLLARLCVDEKQGLDGTFFSRQECLSNVSDVRR